MHPCEGQLGRARVKRAAAKYSKRGPLPAQAFLQKSYGNEDLALLTQSLASVLTPFLFLPCIILLSFFFFFHFAFLSTSAFPHPLQTSRCRSSTIGKPGPRISERGGCCAKQRAKQKCFQVPPCLLWSFTAKQRFSVFFGKS